MVAGIFEKGSRRGVVRLNLNKAMPRVKVLSAFYEGNGIIAVLIGDHPTLPLVEAGPIACVDAFMANGRIVFREPGWRSQGDGKCRS